MRVSSAATNLGKNDAHGLGYRPDIDGLRAIAVLSVLFYHAGLPPFSGGFVGVDVFFVISGYLITGIIQADIAAGRFTIAQFYERRVRRIFPALYLTIIVTVAAALLLFSATDLERLFTSITWLAFFASNFYFAENSGYFDGAAEQNAILQTWSLAIEEQFYVFFPPLLALLARWRRVPAGWVIVTLAILSFVFSVYAVDRDARPAFFSTPGRIWELMLGALLAVGFFPRIEAARWRAMLGAVGAALIAGSVVFLSTETPFPGAAALPACAGTAAIIWAGACGPSPVTQALSWRPAVAVGLISYSLYLLHWPILVMLRYWNEAELSAVQTALALSVAVAGAWLSWRYVEQPFRKPAQRVSRRALLSTAGSLMIALGALGGAAAYWQASRTTGTEQYVETEKARALAEPCMIRDTAKFEDWPAANCTIAGSAPIALWGDSFAAHYFGAFRDWAAKSGRGLILLAESSCPPIAGLNVPNRPGCAPFNAGVLARLREQPPVYVVLSADWILYEKKKTVAEVFSDKFTLLSQTIASIRATGAKVLVMGPSPVFPAPVAQIALGSANSDRAVASYSRKFDSFFRALAARGDIAYFPAYEVFCHEGSLCRYREAGELYFWDTGHMTTRGSAMVVEKLTGGASLQP